MALAFLRFAVSQDLFLANPSSDKDAVNQTNKTLAGGDTTSQSTSVNGSRVNTAIQSKELSLHSSSLRRRQNRIDVYEIQWLRADQKYCLSTDGNHFRVGQNIQLYWCRVAIGQLFRFHPSGRIQLDANPGLCVVTDRHNSWGSRRRVFLGQCDFSDLTQQWRWDKPGSFESQHFPGKCIMVKDNRGLLYNDIILGDCHAPWDKHWDAFLVDPPKSSYIKWSGAGQKLCLSTDGFYYRRGINLRLDYCSPKNVGQHFRLTRDGLIQLDTDPSLCIVIDWGSSQDGANILLWTCDESVAVQKWELKNDVYVRNTEIGKCIVVKDGIGTQYNNIVLGSCYGSTYWMTSWD
eukprot:TRINITY_DN41904_c0_g1_i1.p1 TRINITY_DN41904_c0_g1~~TRINITY_DN41904_c0_g1_i1.p1  ORF type:complete len:374 (+),score=23.82 TRINITY_DN41904_c0_g1_i1:80-1123(+)